MATLIYVDKGEVKASGIELRNSLTDYSVEESMVDYDKNGNEIGTDNVIHQELDLNGIVGMKKLDERTLKLSFNDGDVFNVNIRPSKMENVMAQIRSKSIRKSSKKIIGY